MPRRALRLAGLVFVVGVAVVVTIAVDVPTGSELRDRFSGVGVWPGIVFAGLYAVVTLSPLPKTVFTLAAGAMFGIGQGLVVVSCGATAGAVAAFWLARLLGRDFVLRIAPRLEGRLDDLMLTRGLWTVLAARLIPVVPFTTVNYLSGLTAVRLRVFVLGTVLGMVPATSAYVVLGAYGSRPGSWPFWSALGGLVLLTVAGVLGTWRRRRPHRRALPDECGADVSPTSGSR